jgi:hypothetical protein
MNPQFTYETPNVVSSGIAQFAYETPNVVSSGTAQFTYETPSVVSSGIAQPDTMFLPVFKETVPPANRIPRDDYRYNLLQTIPEKEYDAREDMNYVYLRINDEKDYFITVHIRPKSDTDYDEYHGNTQNDSSTSNSDDSTNNDDADCDDHNETHKENHDTDYWDDNGYPNFTDILQSSLLSNPYLLRSYGYYVKPYIFLANETTEEQGNVDEDQEEEIKEPYEQDEEPDEEEEEEEEEETVVETQVQTFRYSGNRVSWLSGAKVYIK